MKIKDMPDSEFFIEEPNHIFRDTRVYKVPSIYNVFLLEDNDTSMLEYHSSDREKQIAEIHIHADNQSAVVVFSGPGVNLEYMKADADLILAVYNASVTWNGIY